jgi:hypothetical protein
MVGDLCRPNPGDQREKKIPAFLQMAMPNPPHFGGVRDLLFSLGGRTFSSDVKPPTPHHVIPSGAARLFLPHGLCAPGRGGRNLSSPPRQGTVSTVPQTHRENRLQPLRVSPSSLQSRKDAPEFSPGWSAVCADPILGTKKEKRFLSPPSNRNTAIPVQLHLLCGDERYVALTLISDLAKRNFAENTT